MIPPILLIILLPFGIWGVNIHQGHLNALIMIVLGCGVYFCPRQAWPLGFVCLGWYVFAVFANYLGFMPPQIYMEYLNSTLLIMIMISCVLMVYYSKVELERWFDLICISALIQGALAITQFFWFDPISTLVSMYIPVFGDFDFRTATGLTGNPNYLGAYMAISLPLFIRPRWYYGIPIIVIALLASKSSGAILAGAVGMLWHYLGWMGALAGVLVGGGHYWLTHNLASEERFELWSAALNYSFSSPFSAIVGYGTALKMRSNNAIHNEVLSVLFHFGLIGLVCVWYLIKSIWTQNKLLNTALVTLLVNCLPNHPFHVAVTGILGFTLLTLALRENNAR